LPTYLFSLTRKYSLLRNCSFLLGQRSESKVGLYDAKLGEQLLGLLVVNGRVDNHIITRNPVDWSSDLVLITSLKRVDDAENLGGVAASRGGIRQDESDGLLGVDDEDGSDGEGNALGVYVGGVLVVEHVIEVGNLAYLVGNDGERHFRASNFIDILDPSLVAAEGVGRETDQLDAALGELGLELGEGTKLGGAYGCVVLRM